MSLTDFARFAGEFGIGWAVIIALAIAYWLEVQDRKKNCVQKELYSDLQCKVDKIISDQNKLVSSIETVANLVKVAIFGSKGGGV